MFPASGREPAWPEPILCFSSRRVRSQTLTAASRSPESSMVREPSRSHELIAARIGVLCQHQQHGAPLLSYVQISIGAGRITAKCARSTHSQPEFCVRVSLAAGAGRSRTTSAGRYSAYRTSRTRATLLLKEYIALSRRDNGQCTTADQRARRAQFDDTVLSRNFNAREDTPKREPSALPSLIWHGH